MKIYKFIRIVGFIFILLCTATCLLNPTKRIGGNSSEKKSTNTALISATPSVTIELAVSPGQSPLPTDTLHPPESQDQGVNTNEIRRLWAYEASSDLPGINIEGALGIADALQCKETYSSWYNDQPAFSPNEYFLELKYEYPLIPTEINLTISGNPEGHLRVEVLDSSSGLGSEVFNGMVDTHGKCPGTLLIPVKFDMSVDKIILAFTKSDQPMFIDAVELVGKIDKWWDLPVFWRIPIPSDYLGDPKSDLPGGLASDSLGNIFVANGHNGLYRYDVEGNLLQEYHVPEESNIRDVALDPLGRIIITDLIYQWYITYDQDGLQVDAGGEDFGWNSPREVAVHPKTGNIYLLDETDDYSQIRVYSPENNELIQEFPLETIGLQMHKGLAFDPDGFLYTLDQIHELVLKIDVETGEEVNSFGYLEMDLASPSDLAIDDQGNIYVLLNSSPDNTAVYVYDLFGSLKLRLGLLTYDGSHWQEGVFFFPVGISVSPDGRFLSILEVGYLTTYLLNDT